MIFLAAEVILYFPTPFNRRALKPPLRVSCVPGAKAPEAFSGASDQKGGHCRWHSNAATSQRRGRVLRSNLGSPGWSPRAPPCGENPRALLDGEKVTGVAVKC